MKKPGFRKRSASARQTGAPPHAAADAGSKDFLLTHERAKGASRRSLTKSLFNHIAPGYDRMNTVLSLGRDQAWKRRLVKLLPLAPDARVLDLATGTGDLLFLLHRRFPEARLTGVDLSPGMLAIGKRRAAGEAPNATIAWREGEMNRTGAKSMSFDAVTAGYALRNASDLEASIAEIARVLKPGGHAAILEFSKSRNALWQKLALGFLWAWGGFWGWVVHRNPHIYQYFAHSLSLYPDHPALLGLFRKHRLECVRDLPLNLGLLRILLFRKAPSRTISRSRG